MEKLPTERTSVVTIVRNPVDRVLSSYEFAVEVAARFLVHPDLASVAKMSKQMLKKSNGVSTLDIWPWKYLVPWMMGDLFARVCVLLADLVHFMMIFFILPCSFHGVLLKCVDELCK